MDLGLQDKVVIVTGGANGIGKAVVQGACREGAAAVIVDRDRKAGEQLQTALTDAGFSALFLAADLSEPDNCQTVVASALEKFQRIDVLVNNAGSNDRAGLTSSVADFRRSLALNLIHYFAMAHYALPALKESCGTIVNIGSKVAVTGQGGTSGYAAAKGGIHALTREWATELAKDGIRVNEVLPGDVMTPMYENWLNLQENPQAVLAEISAAIPLGKRMAMADEVAAAVLFLASEKASQTTGQYFYVDGGYTHLDRRL